MRKWKISSFKEYVENRNMPYYNDKGEIEYRRQPISQELQAKFVNDYKAGMGQYLQSSKQAGITIQAHDETGTFSVGNNKSHQDFKPEQGAQAAQYALGILQNQMRQQNTNVLGQNANNANNLNQEILRGQKDLPWYQPPVGGNSSSNNTESKPYDYF